MTEVSNPVRAIRVNYLCRECGEGFMLPSDNFAMMTNPPQYRHKCNKCGAEDILTSCYPLIKHIDVVKKKEFKNKKSKNKKEPPYQKKRMRKSVAVTLSPDILRILKSNAPGGNVSKYMDQIFSEYFGIEHSEE